MNPITHHRLAQGLSQGELAERAGLNRRTVNRTELGYTQGRRALVKIADALGVCVDELFTDKNAVRFKLVGFAMDQYAALSEGAELQSLVDRLNALARVRSRSLPEIGTFSLDGEDLVYSEHSGDGPFTHFRITPNAG